MDVRRLVGAGVSLGLVAAAAVVVSVRDVQPGVDPGPPMAVTANGAAAARAARVQGSRVEITSLRTETQTIYAEPNGTMTAVLSTRPKRVKQGNDWVDLDTTMVRRPDGTVGPKAIPVDLDMSGGGTATPLVTYGKEGRRISLSWPGRLPTPRLDGDKATYAEVLPGIDLVMRAKDDGYAQYLVVKNAASAGRVKHVRFGLRTSGVTVKATKTGALEARDANGKVLFAAPASRMWDSSPTERQAIARVSVDAQSLTLTPDQALLRARTTRFPVTIDPDWATIGWNWGGGGWTSVLSGSDRARWNSSASPPWAQTGQCWNGKGECGGIGEGWSYFQYYTGGLGGTHILSVTLDTVMEHGPNCATPRDHQLFIAGGRIDGNTRWGNRPGGGLLHQRSIPGCGRQPIGFSAGTSIHHNDGGGISTYFLKAYDGNDQNAWRRYDSNQTYLKVNFNRYPNPAYGLSTDPPVPAPCKWCANQRYLGGDFIRLIGHLSDNDPGETLRPEWDIYTSGAREDRDPDVWQVSTAAHETTLDLRSKDGKTIDWYLRAWDHHDAGGWAQGPAPFVVDRTPPNRDDQKPAISARLYKADNRWHGGAGVKDTFTLTAKDAPGVTPDIDHFYWGWTSPPTNRVDADALGGKAVVELTPPGDGARDLFVQSADRADNRSQISQHHFYVRAGNGPLAQWSFEGNTTDDAFLGDRDGTLNGNARYGPGAVGLGLKLDGQHYGTNMAAPSTVRTDTSFTVSAWVKPEPNQPNQVMGAVSQDGDNNSGFYLSYRGDLNKWAMLMLHDGTSLNPPGTYATAPAAPQLGRWTHLTGVYDRPGNKILLYVNGVKAAESPLPANFVPWHASGSLFVGRQKCGVDKCDPWAGSIDEVNVFDRVLDPQEVRALVGRDNVAAGQWRFDELTGTTAGNALDGGESVVLRNGASFTGQAGGVIGGGVRLDGVDDYAATSGPVLHTDQSYTVSAWVVATADASAGNTRTAVSAEGNVNSAFFLGYRATNGGKWELFVPSADSGLPRPGDAFVQSDVAAQLNTPTHLAAVYDAPAHEVRLYVNGKFAGKTAQNHGFDATGPLVVGRGKWEGSQTNPWAGVVDELRAYGRELSEAEIQGIVARSNVAAGKWKLDGNPKGETAAQDGTVHGNPDWTGGQSNVPDQTDLAVRLNGTDAHVSAPNAVDVKGSFSVAAWLKPDKLGGWWVPLSQDGNTVSAFKLQLSAEGNWTFVMFGADATNGGPTGSRAIATRAQVGVWQHVVCVYDASAGKLLIYVNGVLAGTAPHTQSWNYPTGRFVIGADKWNGVRGQFFPGAIDDVAAYSRVLFADEIQAMAGRDLSLVHHWQVDEPSGANAADTVGARNATLLGSARRVPGRIGNAVHLDGADDAAQSTGVDLRTDQSFTVSAWVYLDRKSEPVSQFTAVSVDGATNSKFRLGHVADENQNFCLDGVYEDPNKCGAWIFEMPNGDDGSPPLKAAVSTLPAEITRWTHLTGVYDRLANRIWLYVDGSRVGDGTLDNAWPSSGRMQIGRALAGGARVQHWPGSVDDVRLYAGALDNDRISNLFRSYPAPSGPVTLPVADAGRWKFDESSGTTAADSSGRNLTATMRGGASWIGGRNGPGAWLDGTSGYAETTGPVLDTTKSFSAAAWVYLTGTVTGHRTVLAQDGSQLSTFLLQYQAETNKWAAMVPGTTGAVLTSTELAAKDEWTHLAVVYDANLQQLRLYVQGVLSAAQTGVLPAGSTGPFTIGRAKWNGGNVDFFSRGIDDVRAFGRALSDGEVGKLHDDVYAGMLDLYRFDDNTARDYGWRNNHGTASGGASYGEGVFWKAKALQLDGSTGAVVTPWRAVVMADSFTVSAWAKLSSKSKVATVLGQDGQRASGFVLQYRPSVNRWVFGGPTQDADTAEMVYAVSAKQPLTGEWNHLTGVYDHAAHQLRLYVDGELAGTRNNVNLTNANGGFTIGRGQFRGGPADYFPGWIDEVQTEQGIPTDAEIAQRGGWPAPPGGQLGRYVNAAGDHYTDSTDKPVRAGYHFEGTLGTLAAAGPNTRMLYACLMGSDAFTSMQTDCEGRTKLGDIGLVYTVAPTNLPTEAVYRCNFGSDHMESRHDHCEGATNEGLLGYTVGYVPLARYYSDDNRDHWTTVHGTAPSYRLEGTLGWLARVNLPGTQPLQSCLDGTDEFTSLDPGCEGKTFVSTIGYIYPTAPDGMTTQPIYRCLVNGQKWVALSATCHGYTVDRLLGYVHTARPATTPTFP